MRRRRMAVFHHFEAAQAPRSELHDAVYARSLITQGGLAWEDQRAMAGGNALRDLAIPNRDQATTPRPAAGPRT